MLVLSRTVGEFIQVGTGETAILIKVIYVSHLKGKVRVGLGIQAPR